MKRLAQNLKIQAILSITVVFGGLLLISFGNVDSSDKIGLFGIMGVVLNYYFGSSRSSTVKDETISEMSKK